MTIRGSSDSERLERIEHLVEGIASDQTAVKADISDLKTDVAMLKTDVAIRRRRNAEDRHVGCES